MSKMGQLHAELTEQAFELGFNSLEDAEAYGWQADYEIGVLKPPVAISDREIENAHKYYVEWRKDVLHNLLDIREWCNQNEMTEFAHKLTDAISFIRNGGI